LFLLRLVPRLTLASGKRIVDIVMTRRDMLADYFSLTITADGKVEGLPLLLQDYIPNLDKLPHFLMRLGPQVWNDLPLSVCKLTAFAKG
jgi:hypothetical protein